MIGQQLQVSLASVTGPGQRRTLVCSLSEPLPRAAAPAPPTKQDNEWLQGVPAVNLPASRLSRSRSTRKAKAKRRAKSGGLLSHRRTPDNGSQCGTLSGVSGGEVAGYRDTGGSGGADGLKSCTLQPLGAPAGSAELFTRSAAAAAEATGAIPAAHGRSANAISEMPSTSAGSMKGSGLAPVEPLQAVPHAELVEAARRQWQMPRTMARECCRNGVAKLRTTWGQEQEAAALLEVLHVFPGSTLHEVGLFMLNQEAIPAEWEVPVHKLPPIGSSPDGLLYHPALPQPPSAADAATPSGSAPPGASAAVTGQSPQAEVSAMARAAERRQRAAMAGGRRWSPEVYEAIALPGLWEVVEVKNHCPFQEAGGKGRGRWVFCDSGPRTAVPEQYVPQLQLEMLCAGLQSALLVSRSATRGTHIFRMWRSDRYCALLLRLAAAFYEEVRHQRCCRAPQRNLFAGWPVFEEYCRLTLDLKQRTALLCRLAPGDSPFDQSQPLFR